MHNVHYLISIFPRSFQSSLQMNLCYYFQNFQINFANYFLMMYVMPNFFLFCSFLSLLPFMQTSLIYSSIYQIFLVVSLVGIELQYRHDICPQLSVGQYCWVGYAEQYIIVSMAPNLFWEERQRNRRVLG